MGQKYSSQASSGYSSSPPSDDGTVSAANKVTYATLKSKLGDPLKTFIEAVNTQLLTALDYSATAQSAPYTTTAADHQKPIEVTGTTTISLGDAASMGVGYQTTIVNKGTNTVTVALITGANTLDGVAAGTAVLAPNEARTFGVNQAANGYRTLSGGNALPAGIMLDYGGTATPAGWFLCDGSAKSRTTYVNLFTAIGTTWGAGDGSTTFNLPPPGRVWVGSGTATTTETVTSQAASGNAIPVASNNTKWITGMPVTLSAVSGYTGISNGAYFIVRASATTVKFATSLANAQNGTVVTVTGTGSAILTSTFTARTTGELGGEEAHAMSSTEILAHTHTFNAGPNTNAAISITNIQASSLTETPATSSVGGNAAMNIMPLFGVVTKIIKF